MKKKQDNEVKKPLEELKIKKNPKLEKLDAAPDEAIAMALRKLMSEQKQHKAR